MEWKREAREEKRSKREERGEKESKREDMKEKELKGGAEGGGGG
jgi:hypothetical protein